MKRIPLIIGFFLFIGLLFAIGSQVRVVQAQAAVNTPMPTMNPSKPTPSDNEVNSVAHQLYCPVCENIPLDVCPTQACANWRELIRLKLSQGQTPQQIKDYFAAQYGVRVLAEPPRAGLNWLVYILPVVFFLGGVGILWYVFRSNMAKNALAAQSSKPAASQASDSGDPNQVSKPSSPEDDYVKKFEEELRKQKD